MVFEAVLFLSVLVISAKLLGELMHRINQPSIIGNVLAGIIVGPAMLAIVQPIDEIDLFISIGVFFLFFLIGLEEIDLPNLFRVLRKRIFAGAGVAFLVPFVVASLFGITIDLSFIQSFAIATVIGASSLGVTAKILTDMGKLRSTIGLEIFTVTAIVEFIAIIVTGVFIQIAETENAQILDFAWLFGNMVLFFAVSGLLAVFVLPKLFRFVRKHLQVKQVYFGLVIGVILLVAYFAEISGVHGAIGALLLGIAMSRMQKREYTEISQSVNAIGYGIFIPIFFAGIGLHFTHAFFDIEWWIIAGFIAIIVGVKFVGSYIAVRIGHLRPASTVAFGVMSKGAVDLALMLSLLEFQILDNKIFSLLVFGTLITLVVSSVELQRRLKKVVQVKVGAAELNLTPTYFRRTMSDVTAHDVMIPEYEKISSNTPTDDVKNQFQDSPDKPLLVFDDNDCLVGITSYNYLKRKSKRKHISKISQVMLTKFMSAIPQDALYSVIQKINANKIHIVPVLAPDATKKVRVVGVITHDSVIQTLPNQ